MVCYFLFILPCISFRPSNRLQEKAEKRLTCFRVSVALVLLAIVLVFALLQRNKYWPDPDGMDISMEHDDHHQHTTMEEDDEDDGEDHHHHQHTALYHHAVVLTASGLDFFFFLLYGPFAFKTTFLDRLDSQCFNKVALFLLCTANCSSIGKALLQEGGNVVDAAIASLLCLGVVHPHTAGVG